MNTLELITALNQAKQYRDKAVGEAEIRFELKVNELIKQAIKGGEFTDIKAVK